MSSQSLLYVHLLLFLAVVSVSSIFHNLLRRLRYWLSVLLFGGAAGGCVWVSYSHWLTLVFFKLITIFPPGLSCHASAPPTLRNTGLITQTPSPNYQVSHNALTYLTNTVTIFWYDIWHFNWGTGIVSLSALITVLCYYCTGYYLSHQNISNVLPYWNLQAKLKMGWQFPLPLFSFCQDSELWVII